MQKRLHVDGYNNIIYTVMPLLKAPGAKTLQGALLFRAICVS